jgi:hypothetical protein
MIKNLLFSIVAFAISISLNAQAVWTQQNTAFTNLPTAIGVDQVSVVDANTVWVRGFNGSGAGSALKVFSRTNNGGTTWTAGNFTQLAANEMPYVLGAVNYTTAFAVVMDTVSYATSLWGTTNGGTTWVKETTMFTNASSFANGVRFLGQPKRFLPTATLSTANTRFIPQPMGAILGHLMPLRRHPLHLQNTVLTVLIAWQLYSGRCRFYNDQYGTRTPHHRLRCYMGSYTKSGIYAQHCLRQQ